MGRWRKDMTFITSWKQERAWVWGGQCHLPLLVQRRCPLSLVHSPSLTGNIHRQVCTHRIWSLTLIRAQGLPDASTFPWLQLSVTPEICHLPYFTPTPTTITYNWTSAARPPRPTGSQFSIHNTRNEVGSGNLNNQSQGLFLPPIEHHLVFGHVATS